MLSKFTTRLQSNFAERDAARLEISSLESRVSSLISSLPSRPDLGFGVGSDWSSSIDARIKQLAKDQSQRSMSLSDEKSLLKKIEKLKAGKRDFERYDSSRRTLDELRARLNELRDAETQRRPVIAELQVAIKKLKLAEDLNCGVGDITEKTIASPNAKQLARVIGSQGKNIKKIEEEVSLSFEFI